MINFIFFIFYFYIYLILVEEGTHLDIIELIKYSINKVPNPRLYTEVRNGFIKNYGVSIVIDISISCLNELCIIHTIQTLRILLSAISYDNIPSLDIIITRKKIQLYYVQKNQEMKY